MATEPSALPDLEVEIVVAVRNRLKVSPRIVWLDPNSFERSAHKTRFIEIAGS